MSGGEQQVIALGRGPMARPSLLLLDEPSLGLAPILVDQLFAMLGTLKENLLAQGGGILLVEQNAGKALDIADRIYVLIDGQVAHESPAKDVSPEDLVTLYMGRRTATASGVETASGDLQ